MKLRYKILLTILAAVLYWLLVSCLQRTTLELPNGGSKPPASLRVLPVKDVLIRV